MTIIQSHSWNIPSVVIHSVDCIQKAGWAGNNGYYGNGLQYFPEFHGEAAGDVTVGTAHSALSSIPAEQTSELHIAFTLISTFQQKETRYSRAFHLCICWIGNVKNSGTHSKMHVLYKSVLTVLQVYLLENNLQLNATLTASLHPRTSHPRLSLLDIPLDILIRYVPKRSYINAAWCNQILFWSA